MRVIARLILFLLSAVGLLTLLLFGGLVVAVSRFDMRPPAPPERAILTVNLDRGIAEGYPDSPFDRYANRRHYLMLDLVEGLRRAAADPRVLGLVVHIGEANMTMAGADEFRRAVQSFRQAGKPAYAFSESFSGTAEYYLASAFDEVWLQPSGDVEVTGFLAEAPFLRDALDKLGILPVFSARHEYKGAPEIFTANAYSPPSREVLDALLAGWNRQVAEAVAADRRLEPAQVRALIDRAPLLAREAKQAGLVDRLGYRDEMRTAITDKLGGAEQVDLRTYVESKPPVPPLAIKIAVIHGIGVVQRGESHFNPVASSAVMGARTVVKAFTQAIDDPDVAAILFRIDSPGGDYVASDAIWREVRRARIMGKPVVVSMGNMAASGGYFVAMGADAIVAEAGTITGSIGVFAGKFVLRDFWSKLGVTWDGRQVGTNAAMWSSNQDFTPAQRQRFESMLDAIYADFTTKAADGRELSAEQIDKAARGRIFTGVDARQHGLVDELGGFDTALKQLRKRLALKAETPIDLVPYPEPKSLEETVADLLSGDDLPLELGGMSGQAELAELMRVARPFLPLLRAAGPQGGVLRLPPSLEATPGR